ncbi:MAG: YfhO family protein [Oscillospiraceae bacterium]|nr:YfhO family protein [Oscillospiraceae bacterium]
MINKKTSENQNCTAASYLRIFLIAFITFAVTIIPVVIYNKGYLTYYGDFNSQQIPFYYHAHEAVRSGNIFWDWGTDLGSDFLGSYSFYLLGSPFFWITTLFSDKIVLYLIPWLLCLKYSIASLTAYAYIKRFTVKTTSAEIGALLYAFSGFQAYNIFFNHFHDVTALFPLMLIALEETVNNDRRGFFAVTVALMASVNYFFFTGQAVFVILYLIVRARSRDFALTFRKFLIIAGESLLGVCTAMVILLPSALTVLGNYRVSERLYGTDLIAYSEPTRIWRIIQSFFMIPDVPSRPNLFDSDNARWASIGGYLPLFSMIGVCAYLRAKPDKWSSRLIKICIVCSFIPVLNSAFYMLNASYYARWFYMPILIMALVTAQTLENKDISAKPGIRTCMWFYIAFIIISVLPVKKKDEVKWFGMAANLWYFYIILGVTVLFFIFAIRIFYLRKNGRPYLRKCFALTAAASFAATSAVFYYGISIGPYPDKYISASIDGREKISLESSDDEFYRIDVSENYDNFPMLWGFSSMRCFQSVVSSSIMEFYDSVNIQRDVASRAETTAYSLRGLFSVKYYFSKLDENNEEEKKLNMPGFTQFSDQNGFRVYKNDYYVPMGFTYDNYISQEDFEKLSDSVKTNVLMEAVVLSDRQISQYSSLLEKYKIKDSPSYTTDRYLNDCEERINSSCSQFSKSSKGFSARISTDKDNLVFFSVPFDKGFSAYVNGQRTKIEKVSNGFMAVYVPAGESTIKFSYIPYGLQTGFQISAVSLLMLITYMVIIKLTRVRNKKYFLYDNDLTQQFEGEAPIASIMSAQNEIIDFDIDEPLSQAFDGTDEPDTEEEE